MDGLKWLLLEDNLLYFKRFPKEVDNPDLGTGFTVRAAWFPT